MRTEIKAEKATAIVLEMDLGVLFQCSRTRFAKNS